MGSCRGSSSHLFLNRWGYPVQIQVTWAPGVLLTLNFIVSLCFSNLFYLFCLPGLPSCLGGAFAEWTAKKRASKKNPVSPRTEALNSLLAKFIYPGFTPISLFFLILISIFYWLYYGVNPQTISLWSNYTEQYIFYFKTKSAGEEVRIPPGIFKRSANKKRVHGNNILTSIFCPLGWPSRGEIGVLIRIGIF